MMTTMPFPDWINQQEAAGSTKADIANSIGVRLPSLYRYLARERVPDRTTMSKIIEVSGGRVETAWFYQPDEDAA